MEVQPFFPLVAGMFLVYTNIPREQFPRELLFLLVPPAIASPAKKLQENVWQLLTKQQIWCLFVPKATRYSRKAIQTVVIDHF